MWSISRPWTFRQNQIGLLQIYPLLSLAPSTPRFLPLPRPKISPDAGISAQLGVLSLDLGIDDEETYFAKILLMRYLGTDPNHNLDTSDPDINVAFPLPYLHQRKSSRIDS